MRRTCGFGRDARVGLAAANGCDGPDSVCHPHELKLPRSGNQSVGCFSNTGVRRIVDVGEFH
jgi:hypothetical protein